MPGKRLFWTKAGDCRDEVQQMCEVCRQEAGRLVGEPDTKVIRSDDGRPHRTILVAESEWWTDQLRTRRGWKGPWFEDDLWDTLDPLPDPGSRQDK